MPGQPGLDSKAYSQSKKVWAMKLNLCFTLSVESVMCSSSLPSEMSSHSDERWHFRSPRKSFLINMEIKIPGPKGAVWGFSRGRGQFTPSPPPALPPVSSIWRANPDFSGFSLFNSPNCNPLGPCCAVVPAFAPPWLLTYRWRCGEKRRLRRETLLCNPQPA